MNQNILNSVPASRTTKRLPKTASRQGAAAVEFAITLPVLLAFFFGLWEYGSTEMIRQTSAVAAFEAARLGTVAGTTEAEMRTEAERILARANIQQATIDVSLLSQRSKVDIEVPLDGNAFVIPMFLQGLTIESSYTLSILRR